MYIYYKVGCIYSARSKAPHADLFVCHVELGFKIKNKKNKGNLGLDAILLLQLHVVRIGF